MLQPQVKPDKVTNAFQFFTGFLLFHMNLNPEVFRIEVMISVVYISLSEPPVFEILKNE